MHWKVERDRFFSRIARERGEEAIHESGFFFDTSEVDAPLDDVEWLCTPMPRLPVRGDKPVALLSTGAFCPVHPGHLEMMERAKSAAEAQGFTVVGGYLSPGHDDYVRLKWGEAMRTASERLNECAEAAASTSWLSVDPWEALHRNESVNFTDVTWRLRAYLRKHVDPRIEVFYVCGGDNARFAQAFLHDAGCVVVGRPGWEDEVTRWRERLDPTGQVLWAEGHHSGASRDLHSAPRKRPRPRVVMRLEDERAVRTLQVPNLRDFQHELAAIFREFADVRTVELAAPVSAKNVISLDPLVPGDHTIAVSRLYALGGYQRLAHVPRPGAPPLAEQLRKIPGGRYVLRDDDSVSGLTFAAIRAHAPPEVVIEELTVSLPREPDEDVVDPRDYLLGADEGGLVVALSGGEVARAPYLLPYTDPFARASVPAEKARSFSRAVWALNERIFDPLTHTVASLPAVSRPVFRGFQDHTPLSEVCRWHLKRL